MASPAHSSDQPIRLLLGEDSNFDVRDFTRKMEGWWRNCEISVAKDGQYLLDGLLKRLEMAPDRLPDLIILDLNMPRVGGIELLAVIRQHPRLKHLPVLIWTTSDSPFDTAQTRELGIDGYLLKNGSASALRHAIDDALERTHDRVLAFAVGH